jgi:hypothetical protein
MVSQEQAIEAAWRLFTTKHAASEVQEVEARLIDGEWSVLFHQHLHPDYVDSPDHWLILVPESGQPEWFEVL